MSFRTFLYKLARFMGDVNAVERGDIAGRIVRRAEGRLTSRLLRKLWRR